MKTYNFLKSIKNKKPIAIAAAVCLTVAAVYLVSVTRGQKPSVQTNQEKTYSVKVIEIQSSQNDVALQYSGIVQPSEMEQVIFSTIGKIKKIYVKEGDNVKKGQVLVELNNENAKSQQDSAFQAMRAAEAAKNSSKATLDAAQSAYDAGTKGSTETEIATAKQDLEAAKANRDVLQADLDGINAICQPYRDAVTAAQSELFTAQQEAQEAQMQVNNAQAALDAANGENPQDQQKIADCQAALDSANTQLQTANSNLEEKRLNLAEKQTALIAKENELQRAQKEAQLQAANAQVLQKQATYDTLVNQGTVSVDALKTQLTTAQYSYESATATYESAKSNYNMATKAVEECTYKAKADGYVIKMVSEENSIATPLAPVLVVGSYEMVAQFGVSQTDVRSILPGNYAQIQVSGNTYSGKVKDISVTPDETTRTYITNVIIENAPRDLYLGETATVSVAAGSKDGVWLPITVILNDGEDYVFVVENNRAARKNVVIEDVSNDLVRVKGLEQGGKVISQGMKTVKSGSLVAVIE